jgi:hypothetical protein
MGINVLDALYSFQNSVSATLRSLSPSAASGLLVLWKKHLRGASGELARRVGLLRDRYRRHDRLWRLATCPKGREIKLIAPSIAAGISFDYRVIFRSSPNLVKR